MKYTKSNIFFKKLETVFQSLNKNVISNLKLYILEAKKKFFLKKSLKANYYLLIFCGLKLVKLLLKKGKVFFTMPQDKRIYNHGVGT